MRKSKILGQLLHGSTNPKNVGVLRVGHLLDTPWTLQNTLGHNKIGVVSVSSFVLVSVQKMGSGVYHHHVNATTKSKVYLYTYSFIKLLILLRNKFGNQIYLLIVVNKVQKY